MATVNVQMNLVELKKFLADEGAAELYKIAVKVQSAAVERTAGRSLGKPYSPRSIRSGDMARSVTIKTETTPTGPAVTIGSGLAYSRRYFYETSPFLLDAVKAVLGS